MKQNDLHLHMLQGHGIGIWNIGEARSLNSTHTHFSLTQHTSVQNVWTKMARDIKIMILLRY